MTSSQSKYAVADRRHHENLYDDYPGALTDQIIDASKNDVHNDFKNILIAKAKDFVNELERNRREWYFRDDFSIYTGLAGIAQMYYHLGKTLKEPSYLMRASELIEKCLKDGRGDKRVSYLAGRPGPLALGAVIHYMSGNEDQSRKIISELTSSAKRTFAEPSNELLYGKIGYLYSLLFVNFNIPTRPVEEQLIKQIIENVLGTGRDYSKSRGYHTPLMYQWHEKEYLGGAHGLAGILYVLLQAREYLTESQLRQDIEPSLNYLEKLRFPSGNLPSSIGNNSDKLVHWCHGAPSITMLFTLAYKVFMKESYLETAMECGEVIWSRGLLNKGYSLCHGVSGNAYTFISLYQQTTDIKYLHRACKFADWCINYGKHCERIPDRPFSLFEGLAGTIYFLVDLCNPKLAKFPGYTL